MNSTNSNIVYFFTEDVNVSFVNNEISRLSMNFSSVKVFTFKGKSDFIFPDNVDISEVEFNGYSTSGVLFGNLFTILGISFVELLKAPKYFLHFSKYVKAISELMRSIYLADQLRNKISDKNAVFYTFWFNQWATVLAILAKKGIIDDFYSRTHGADLFEYRVPQTKRLPFRWFQLKRVSKVFSVSKIGEQYLKKKYPKYTDKISTQYLGTKDHGVGYFDHNSVFTIVSCAHVRNIKRIFLIPEILMNITIPVKWIHIGGESKHDLSYTLYLKNIEKLKQNNKLVTVELKGKMTQAEIMEFYKITSVNLFISVSSTEGLPVSMMEAISFGIPIISTDVGGCREIVTEATGELLPVDFEPQEVSVTIKKFAGSVKNKAEFRKNVRLFWEKNFIESVGFKFK